MQCTHHVRRTTDYNQTEIKATGMGIRSSKILYDYRLSTHEFKMKMITNTYSWNEQNIKTRVQRVCMNRLKNRIIYPLTRENIILLLKIHHFIELSHKFILLYILLSLNTNDSVACFHYWFNFVFKPEYVR